MQLPEYFHPDLIGKKVRYLNAWVGTIVSGHGLRDACRIDVIHVQTGQFLQQFAAYLHDLTLLALTAEEEDQQRRQEHAEKYL